jgi:hypothetical protein
MGMDIQNNERKHILCKKVGNNMSYEFDDFDIKFSTVSCFESEVYIIKTFLEQYGNIKLSQLITNIKGKKIYKCPACNGKGSQVEKSFSTDWKEIVNKCNVCDGFGYTETKKKPRMIVSYYD